MLLFRFDSIALASGNTCFLPRFRDDFLEDGIGIIRISSECLLEFLLESLLEFLLERVIVFECVLVFERVIVFECVLELVFAIFNPEFDITFKAKEDIKLEKGVSHSTSL